MQRHFVRGHGAPRRWLPPAGALAGIMGLLVAACGGGGASTAGARGSNAASGLLAEAACMRTHGVPDYPDPVDGRMTVTGTHGRMTVNGVTLRESKQQVGAAKQACQSTGSGTAGGTTPPEKTYAAFVFSSCMRSHGFPNFPDPTTQSNGNLGIDVPKTIDAKSPQFQNAQALCQRLMKPGGAAAASNS